MKISIKNIYPHLPYYTKAKSFSLPVLSGCWLQSSSLHHHLASHTSQQLSNITGTFFFSFSKNCFPSASDQYPSSSQYAHKWDKMLVDINEEEKNEKLEGDAALNQLFQQIYCDGSDEVKRAMNKSFVSIKTCRDMNRQVAFFSQFSLNYIKTSYLWTRYRALHLCHRDSESCKASLCCNLNKTTQTWYW